MSAKSAAGEAAEKAGSAAKKVAAAAAEAAGGAAGAAKKVAGKVAETVGTAGSAKASDVQSHTEGRGFRKTREGLVVSDKMDKTVVVAVEDRVKHRLYGKVLRQTVRVKAHDEGNTAGVGDRVRVMETRPLSATKRWRLVEILEKAK